MDGWNLSTCAIKHPIELFVAILKDGNVINGYAFLSLGWYCIQFHYLYFGNYENICESYPYSIYYMFRYLSPLNLKI